MAISLSKNGNAIVFTFDDNDHYLGNGEISVPVNSLTLVTDESDMFTFYKAASNDIFISGLYSQIGKSKSELIAWYKENMVGSTGGGGGVTSGDVETMISEATSGLAESSAVTEEISEAVSGKADTSAVTASINAAVSGKMDTSAFNTYSASTDTRLSEDEEVTSAALNALDAALDDKADTTAVTASIAAAVSGKQDTLVSGTNIKTINNESLLGSGNIDIQGGGGKAIVAGTNISVTTGATADTINCTLPISVSTNNRIKISNNNNNVYNNDSIIVGGSHNTANADHTHVGGRYNSATNDFETAFGNANISNKANTTYGNSGNTLLSVGNGVNSTIHHNAFEIRQNGDIYIADTNDTTYQNYYQKPMIKLQDALGGGGLPESAFTAYTASTEARISEDEEVTAAALNTLSTALGGFKLVSLTQAQYDALTTKDSSTLYIITSSN